MATRPKFARMANYLCECVETSHIFLKKALWRMWASPAKVGWRMSTNVSSPGKVGWRMSANVSSPTKQVGECRRKQDRLFYAQITYFICIKRSSLQLAKFAKVAKFAKLAKFAKFV